MISAVHSYSYVQYDINTVYFNKKTGTQDQNQIFT